MEPNLQEPLERLAQALHRAIAESDDVEGALAALRDQGFQAYLLLEVTVALGAAAEPSRQMDFADLAAEGEAPGWVVETDGSEPQGAHDNLGGVTQDDREFLKSIRIRLD